MSDFWKDNISILYRNDKLFEIFPSRNFDINRKLNSLVRLSVYYAIFIFLYKKDKKALLIPLIVLGITYIINIKKNGSLEVTDRFEDMISDYDSKSKCRVPTKENPFMNTAVTDYGKPSFDKACPSYNNIGVQNRINELYNDGIYIDFKDIFNRNTGKRQFMTMPNTQVPNNQGEFGKWLYGKPPTCKEGNSIACLSGFSGGNFTSNNSGGGGGSSH